MTNIVRIPPSPTGKLHLGTARTALFNVLFAQANDAQIIFRWEDTDKERSKAENEVEILEGLRWLGMDFDPAKIIRQSEQNAVHQKYFDELIKAGAIFRCYTTPAEATALREADPKKVFWSPFRDISEADAIELAASDKPFVWRFRTPRNLDIPFFDLIRNEITVSSETIGDFVVARGDGSILYLAANVFDDLNQQISHIVRGEDGISNTPKQSMIFAALDRPTPKYAHIPLVLDRQKRKLSKRNVLPGECVLIEDFRAAGFLPEAVINGLAFLGWHPKTEDEVFDFPTLGQIFKLENVNAASAQFDFDKFLFFNKKWCGKFSDDELFARFHTWASKYLENYDQIADMPNLQSAFQLAMEKGRIFRDTAEVFGYTLSDPGFNTHYLVHEKFGLTAEKSKEILSEILNMLKSTDDFSAANLREISVAKIAEMELKNGTFLWPFRTSLANRDKSAGPFEIGAVLGKDETIRRIERAIG